MIGNLIYRSLRQHALSTLVTAGSRSITATDTVTSSIVGSDTVTVTPALANHLQVTVGGPVSAGQAFNVTVNALDPFNNVDPTYRGTIHFTKTDTASGAVVPTDYTFVAADNGTHTFVNGATLVTAGSRSITATDTSNGSITGTLPLTVSPMIQRTVSPAATGPDPVNCSPGSSAMSVISPGAA